MNRLALVALLIVFLCSCKAEPQKALTETEIKAKVDSILVVRSVEIKNQAAEDLDRRMAIEVKVKADSMIQICQQQSQQLQQLNQPQPADNASLPINEP
jgi:hypothetical protein